MLAFLNSIEGLFSRSTFHIGVLESHGSGMQFRRVGSALFFALMSSLIVFVNKILLTDYGLKVSAGIKRLLLLFSFRFPSVFILAAAQAFSTVAFITAVIPAAYFFRTELGLWSCNLPMFILLRRFSLIFTMIGERLFLGYRFERLTKVSMALLVVGAAIAGLSDISFNAYAYLLVLFNNLMTSSSTVCTKMKLDAKRATKNDVLLLNSAFSFPLLTGVAWLKHDFYNLLSFDHWSSVQFILLLMCSCFGAYLLNLSTILCTEHNTPLTTACVGVSKNIAVTYISMILRSDYLFSWLNCTGIHVSMLGALLYIYQAFVRTVTILPLR
ncbi:putative UDP-sugar transporter sqv-7 [Trichuris suis]|nr:putative UDP-sugar transporter sqv-7 [Trichuris suis]